MFNRFILIVLFLFLPACEIAEAAGFGSEVLGVEVPGRLTVVLAGGADGSWALYPIGGTGFGWSAHQYCSLRNSETSSGAVTGGDAGAWMASFVVPATERCLGSPAWSNVFLEVSGRTLVAGPTDATSIDALQVGGNAWRAAVEARLVRCGRYDSESGAKLASVPCTDGVGGMLAPLIDR